MNAPGEPGRNEPEEIPMDVPVRLGTDEPMEGCPGEPGRPDTLGRGDPARMDLPGRDGPAGSGLWLKSETGISFLRRVREIALIPG
jgi:hypothetical protein